MQTSTTQSAQQRSPSSTQLTACLRLSRGSSPQATWLLEDVPGGTTITVGAHPSCDWQIKAACVAPHALSVLLIGGAVFVASGPDAEVLLDGKPIPEEWTQVAGAARIDLGLARIELSWDEKPSAFAQLSEASPRLAREASGPFRAHAPAAERHDAMAAQAQPYSRSALETKPLPEEGTGVRERPSRPGRITWTERLSRLSRPSLSEPAVLRPEGPAGGRLYKLAALGIVTALAYTGWLVLLDWN